MALVSCQMAIMKLYIVGVALDQTHFYICKSCSMCKANYSLSYSLRQTHHQLQVSIFHAFFDYIMFILFLHMLFEILGIIYIKENDALILDLFYRVI